MDPIVPPGQPAAPGGLPQVTPYDSLPSAPDATTAAGAPPPPTPGTGTSGRQRPWWSVVDMFLAIPFIFLLAIGGAVVGTIAEAIISGGLDPESLTDAAAVPASILVIGGLTQQAAQFAWPWLVSKWKGLGLKSDWWFSFKWIDLLWGVLITILLVPASLAIAAGLGALVGLEDENAADNTAFLTDNSGSPWLIGILFMVVIGAPFSEELIFRGLCLQTLKKAGGNVLAVLGSAVAFTLPHFPTSDFSWDGVIVLWGTIFMIGVILALVTLKTKRLGAAIIAHVFFNGFGAIASLIEGAS